MQSSFRALRTCKPSTSALSSGGRSFNARTSLAVFNQARNASQASSSSSRMATMPAAIMKQVHHRSFQSSSRVLAEEVKSQMPFESNVMNLLANNEDFRKLVNEFADRMKELLNIDVHAGQMPSMSDMMRCAQDEKLQELSMKLTKILQADGVNLSPDTLKMIWNNMQGKGGQ